MAETTHVSTMLTIIPFNIDRILITGSKFIPVERNDIQCTAVANVWFVGGDDLTGALHD